MRVLELQQPLLNVSANGVDKFTGIRHHHTSKSSSYPHTPDSKPGAMCPCCKPYAPAAIHGGVRAGPCFPQVRSPRPATPSQ